MRNIPITYEEHLQLLKDAPLRTTVDTTIGLPVKLIVSDSNEWAIKRLAEIRGVNL